MPPEEDGKDVFEDAIAMFDAYFELREGDARFDRPAFEEELAESFKEIVERTRGAIKATDNPFARRAVLLLTKGDLYDVCTRGLLDFLAGKNPDAAVFLDALRDTLNGIASGWRALLEDQFQASDRERDTLEGSVERAEDSTAALLLAADKIEKERSSLSAEKDAMALELDLLRAEVKELRAMAASERGRERERGRRREVSAGAPERGHQREDDDEGEEEDEEEEDEEEDEEEEEEEGEQAHAHARGGWERGGGGRGGEQGGGGAERAPPAAAPHRRPRQAAPASFTPAPRPNPPLPPPPAPPPSAWEPRGQAAGSSSSFRQLTLKQIRDLIDDVYASKARSDNHNAAQGLPRETMEQHIYTYLNQKFGLKKLILDWAGGILRAVERYSPHDCEVALFGKVLRNQVEEEYRGELRQLSEAAVDALRAALRARYPREEECAAQLLRKVDGHAMLSGGEWEQVVGSMYSRAEAELLAARIREVAGEGTSNGEAFEVPFSKVVQVILRRALEGHEQLLEPMVAAFRSVDVGSQGILTQEAFLKFCEKINPDSGGEEAGALLGLLDERGTGAVTFSSVMHLLGQELSSIVGSRQRRQERGCNARV